jgi:hypothetical protein
MEAARYCKAKVRHEDNPMPALTTLFELSARSVATREAAGLVTGGVRAVLRLEGLAVLAAAIAFYGHCGFAWPVFALFFLAPDLSMLAYAAGPRIGAAAYNVAHTETLAIALTAVGLAGGVSGAAAGGLIWIAHIGFDRALGYGLKYSTGFRDTHLSRTG